MIERPAPAFEVDVLRPYPRGLLVGGPLEEGEYKADCPTQASVSGESLSVTVTEDRVLLKCWSGCQTTDILAALGLTWPDLFFASFTNGQRGRKEKQRPPKLASFVGAEKVYEYTTPAGDSVSAAVRFPQRNSKRVIRQAFFYDGNWWWQKPEGFKPVPYNLPGIYNAVMSGEPLYIFEGEPDAEAAAEWGLVGTTAPEGAGKFSEALVPYFRGADVRVNQDDDQPGAEHAEQVASMLHGTARSVKLLPSLPNPDGKLSWDFRDWHSPDYSPALFRARAAMPRERHADLCHGLRVAIFVRPDEYPSGARSTPVLLEGVAPGIKLQARQLQQVTRLSVSLRALREPASLRRPIYAPTSTFFNRRRP
jgi:hypothetical protein